MKLIEAELNSLGAYKITMPILGPKELWEMSGRWESFRSEMFHLADKVKQEYCLQPTHEEMIAKMIAQYGYFSVQKSSA